MFSQRLSFRGSYVEKTLLPNSDCEHRADDDAGKEEKALVREATRAKSTSERCREGALAEREKADSDDNQKDQRAIEAMQINAAPLVDYSDVELLTELEIERIDHGVTSDVG